MKNRRAYMLSVGLFGLLACLTARADLWATNGPLLTARSSHTATLLPNGKVLIAGGASVNADYPNGVFLASAELYDPATGTCTNTGSMKVARAYHTATLLKNGKVLVVGGRNGPDGAPGTNILSDAELYDPTTGAWSMTGTPQVPHATHTATLLQDGTVLVAGGVTATAAAGPFVVTNSAELYNPATGTWSEVRSMNTVRFGHTATLLPNGQVLVAGGADSNTTPISSVEIYDPVSATWTATNSLNTARAAQTATLLPNGQVLVAGGIVGFYASTSAEVFDPTTGIWTTTNSMNIARDGHTATLLPNGNVLMAGGYSGGYVTNGAEIYNTATGTWTNAAFMNFARATQVATLLPSGKVLVTGGNNNNGYLATTETYDYTVNPATGAWSNTAPMQNARASFTLTLLPNGKVLASGGEQGGGDFFSSTELYDPAGQTWTYTGAMNESRDGHTATLLPNGQALVAGGGSTISPALSSAELYDPLTGQWTETTPMNAERVRATATLLHNGKVLVAGGNLFTGGLPARFTIRPAAPG